MSSVSPIAQQSQGKSRPGIVASGLTVAHGISKPRAEPKVDAFSMAANGTSGILSSYTAKGA